MQIPKSEFDTPWKKIFDVYFKDFIIFCWPEVYSEIDWSKGYKMLDKELGELIKNAPVGNKVVDKLVEVYLKTGKKGYVLIHLEIQAQISSEFAERMFIYRCQLRNLYPNSIASIAVLIDSDPKWRPNFYREELWGSSIEVYFPIIKLIDFKDKIRELENSNNPFADVILVQLAALEQQKPEARLMSKISLIRRLYSRGRQKDDIINLLVFIDWVISLPSCLDHQCWETIQIVEEELHADYVTSFQRIGRQEGESTMLLSQLEHKFRSIPEDYRQQVQKASADELLKWGMRVLDCRNIEEVFKD